MRGFRSLRRLFAREDQRRESGKVQQIRFVSGRPELRAVTSHVRDETVSDEETQGRKPPALQVCTQKEPPANR
jgi:hypothetical protein